MISANSLPRKGSCALLLLCCSIATGCASTSRSSSSLEAIPQTSQGGIAPAPLPQGVALHVWEEPMVDVIDVPPGLDPEGYYYRPAHKEVVEIRQGRWRHYREDIEADNN